MTTSVLVYTLAVFNNVYHIRSFSLLLTVNIVGVDADKVCIEVWKSGHRWVRGNKSDHTKYRHVFTHATLIELVRYLVSNTFLKCGGEIHKQVVGIPMGTNCAPTLANLFLYYYESSFISRLEAEEGVSTARDFHMTFRLIDDVLSVDNPHMESSVAASYEEGGIYPASLSLNKTTASTSEADFVGIHIETGEQRFHLSVYDKRKTFPFHVRRYPLMSSLIPKTIPYGVFVGQLHRGYRTCSRVDDFLRFAVEVAMILRDNGCKVGRLRKFFNSFASRHMKKYFSVRSTWVCRQFRQMLGSK